MSIYINVFISHSWAYSGHYEKLYEWIFYRDWKYGSKSINFKNFSVPKDDPIHNTKNTTELRNRIFNKIALCHVVIIPTGMYASYSKWISEEIAGANNYGKPKLAVNPWGQQRKSSVVQQASDKMVGWNSQVVFNGIMELYYS